MLQEDPAIVCLEVTIFFQKSHFLMIFQIKLKILQVMKVHNEYCFGKDH